MKAACMFTVLALLSCAAAFGFAVHAGVLGLAVRLLPHPPSPIETLDEVALGVMLLAVLTIGSILLTRGKTPKRSVILNLLTWGAAILGVIGLLSAVINLDVYGGIEAVARPRFAAATFRSLVDAALGFGVSAIAMWLNLAIVTTGRRRAAIDAVT